ncbi:MAG: pentapeptide repeat-containing protein [Francisellaceae bacterium]|jgi:uncharacterized protein YjbI with pentapeptide repeats|nr:pentapeptide repeat-containing protein [Francisellaceae bacterium]MBT6207090.1 pentapeptide repeat-containing protein [Francisellaceae bacterium]MBT6538974.1 pentapeptide repeat-containing protein [Francisellaceae bacterium]
MKEKPQITEDEMYQLLRSQNIQEFNEKLEAGLPCDLTNCDFRSLDLRGINASNLNLRNAYFRNTDLRGIDLRTADIEGATFASAKISGCYFPDNISATEIQLSVEHGTRIRVIPVTK